VERPEIVSRNRDELADPTGRVRKNVYQSARALEPEEAATLVKAAEHIAAKQAAAAIGRAVRDAAHEGAVVRSCAVVVGRFPRGVRLESILKSHALAHAAEGRLYQDALLKSARSHGLDPTAIPSQSLWEDGERELGVARAELPLWLAELRRTVGPPWAQDQKLAALAAWIALTRSP
jgi:hypothetical protein